MMHRRCLHSALAFGLILACVGAVVLAAEPTRIDRLVEQLGSPKFPEREAATKELDAVGEPALDALKKAAASAEPEKRRRAEDLLARIERRVETARILAPTRVRLAFKETPLSEAVQELAKRSGYAVRLQGDAETLKGRTVTLETGAVSFWQALDQLCAKGGLVEVTSVEVPLPQPINPVRRPRAPRGLPLQIMPPAVSLGQLLLKDGKPQDVPTHYAGAVRVRTVPLSSATSRPAPVGQLQVMLGASVEMRIQLQHIIGVRVEKALDEHGQELAQVTSADAGAAAGAPVFIGNFQGMARGIVGTGEQQVAVRLKPGEKPAKILKQLVGSISAQVQTVPEPVMAVADVLKATGKTVKGKDGGQLTLAEIARQDDGTIRVRAELQEPVGHVINAPVMPGRIIVAPAGRAQGIQIQVQAVGAPKRLWDANDPMGLSLVDSQGKAFELAGVPQCVYRFANGVATNELTLTFRPHKEQGEPAKLVYSSKRVVTIEVPFMLKDVPVP
jgi:hypothetical protein